MICLEDFKKIFGCKKKIDFWFFGNDCEIDNKGIRARPLADKGGNKLAITEKEREALEVPGNNIKLNFSCTFIELFEWCKKNNGIEKLMSSPFVSKENSRIPYNSIDREELEARILKSGPPTTSLKHFIDFILTDAIGGNYDAIQTFYQLVEKDKLLVYDKVIDGKPIGTKILINYLKKREQQADDAFGDDDFQFWEELEKIGKYSVYRDNVEEAYKNAGQLKFPWVTWNNEFIWLNYLEKSFKQRNWEEIPDINQKYWKQRDTLNIIELAFILKGKEPQPKATQRNVINLYPLDFCEFFGELLTLSDSSWKAGKLTEINPPSLYCEESAESPDFERKYLIEWAVSKELEVPNWLIMTSSILKETVYTPTTKQPATKTIIVKTQSENNSNNVNVAQNIKKPRKKLIPLIRETNEALLLIYEFFEENNISYLDEMSATKAWGIIVSKKFTSSYIKSLPETKTGFIILNGYEKLDKQDFLEKYRKRFQIEKI